jgi:hypothetical protein
MPAVVLMMLFGQTRIFFSMARDRFAALQRVVDLGCTRGSTRRTS